MLTNTVPYAAPPAIAVSFTISTAASSPEISPLMQAEILSTLEIAQLIPAAIAPDFNPTSFAVPNLSLASNTAFCSFFSGIIYFLQILW